MKKVFKVRLISVKKFRQVIFALYVYLKVTRDSKMKGRGTTRQAPEKKLLLYVLTDSAENKTTEDDLLRWHSSEESLLTQNFSITTGERNKIYLYFTLFRVYV